MSYFYAIFPLGLALGVIGFTQSKGAPGGAPGVVARPDSSRQGLDTLTQTTGVDSSPTAKNGGSNAVPTLPGNTRARPGLVFGLQMSETWLGLEIGRSFSEDRGQVFVGLDASHKSGESFRKMKESNRELEQKDQSDLQGIRGRFGFESWTPTHPSVILVASSSLAASKSTGSFKLNQVSTETSMFAVPSKQPQSISNSEVEWEITEYALTLGIGLRIPSRVSALSLKAKVESGVALRTLEETPSSVFYSQPSTFTASETDFLDPTWTFGLDWKL